jgi:hypothetical protein
VWGSSPCTMLKIGRFHARPSLGSPITWTKSFHRTCLQSHLRTSPPERGNIVEEHGYIPGRAWLYCWKITVLFLEELSFITGRAWFYSRKSAVIFLEEPGSIPRRARSYCLNVGRPLIQYKCTVASVRIEGSLLYSHYLK